MRESKKTKPKPKYVERLQEQRKDREDRNRSEHPSFGMVQFSRVTGGRGKLFGSSVENHNTHIELRIKRAIRENSLGSDWYFDRELLIEVALSAHQFAELLTSMNVGGGVPCTIQHIAGQGEIPPVPEDEKDETQRVKDYFNDSMEELRVKLQNAKDTIDTLAKQKDMKKADREELLGQCSMLVQEVDKNMPFYYDQFNRAIEARRVQHLAELDASMTTMIQRLGFQKLEEMKAALAETGETKALPESDEE